MSDKPNNPSPASGPTPKPAPTDDPHGATAKAQRYAPLVGGAIAGLAIGFLITLIWLGPTQGRFSFLYADFTIDGCLASNGVTDLTPQAAEAEVVACFNRLVRQGQVNEFQIRRVNFLTQHIADTVTLWMVVTLTVCGVALAGWQIFASSKLVTQNPEAMSSELSIESGKIFVRSSVTGLLILIVSFAFFYVYVVWVYQIREWKDDAVVEAQETLGMGSTVANRPFIDIPAGLPEVPGNDMAILPDD